MKIIKLKLIRLVCLFVILNLSSFAESLTDGKGLFKSNELREHVLIENSKIKMFKIKVEKFDDMFVEVLTNFDIDVTFFKWNGDIIPFLGEIVIIDILSNKNSNDFYIFSQSIHSDMACYTVTLMNNEGLRVLGSYQGANIYGDANFQNLKDIQKRVDYIFKTRDTDKYLYSNIDKKFIINYKNKEGVSLTKIKQYFEKYKTTIKDWKGSYLDKRENWMHGEIHNVNNLFMFFEDKECEIILNNKNKLKCTIVKNVSQEDMPMDEKLKSEFQNMDSILVTHRDKKSNFYKHYFFKDINGNYSFSSWYFTSPANASVRFSLKKMGLD